MSFSTPVAFIIFNRPDLTQMVFESIARAKPEKLFVVADGPRFSEEAEKCEQTRAVISKIDWDCEILTNFSDKNLGCGRRVSSGIDWVFSHVEEAIFLEDDCLPAASFFSYCQALLDRYRDDHRVMTINGNNFQFGQKRTDYSYHFSKYNGTWGWGSWRRAWKYYDYEMKTWPEFKNSGMLGMVCEDPYEQRFWTELFDAMYENPDRENTWDHQWKYACWSQSGLAVEPSVNLVSNLGLGRCDATHTTMYNPLLEQLSETKEIREIEHPPFVVRHRAADDYIFDYIVGGNQMKKYALLNRPFDKLRVRVRAGLHEIRYNQDKIAMPTLDDIKKILKLFIPPIVIKSAMAIKELFQKPLLEYAPDGWETRLNNDQNQGWNVESVINNEKSKWDAFCRNIEGPGPLGFSHEHSDLTVIHDTNFHNVHISYAYVLALTAHHKDRISVLDWGGSLGHYYLIGKAVLPDVSIDYHVKEVPLMAEAGRRLNPDVHWYDDEGCLEKSYDLIMLNGSILYLKDWVETLQRIARSAQKYLFLFRLPVVQNSPTFISLERLYHSQMLHQQVNQAELLTAVKETGLILVREFVVGEPPYIKNAPEQCEMRGWLLKRNDA